MRAVVDTNVAIVANGQASHAPIECQLACVRSLAALISNGIVSIDDLGLILDEYRKHLRLKGQPGVGDAFLKYVFDHQHNPDKVEVVAIEYVDDRSSFSSFPDDEELIKFDLSDRKFVAVALASGHSPPIWNATDSDWRKFREPLTRHGIVIEELCAAPPPPPRGRSLKRR
jgi:hypothetical protein